MALIMTVATDRSRAERRLLVPIDDCYCRHKVAYLNLKCLSESSKHLEARVCRLALLPEAALHLLVVGAGESSSVRKQ